MADPIVGGNNVHDTRLAALSLAGIRMLVQATVNVGAGAEGTYTVADVRTKRVILFHNAPSNVDIRVELQATALATHMPVAAAMYFVLRAEKDEVVHLFNTSGSAVVVNVAEIQ